MRDSEEIDASRQADDWWLLWLHIPDIGRAGSVSPLVLYLLAVELDIASDTWGVAEPGDFQFEALPRCARYWNDDKTFPRRMGESCGRAADRIRAGHTEQIATCTADEVNVWIALNDLQTMTMDDIEHDPVAVELAKREPHGIDLESLVADTTDAIGEDHDVELLWANEFDGIESDTTTFADIRFANLHPRDWFKRFTSIVP
jgi:hypothetical protein